VLDANDAVSPLLTTLLAVSVPHIRTDPAVEAVMTANDVTVPQSAVAAGNERVALFDTDPADGVAHLPDEFTRAYDPPVTSVPPAESDGAEVNRATQGVIGVVVRIVVVCPVVAFRTSTS